MASNNGNGAATGHFGKQMRKERVAHGWTLRELADRTGIDFTVLSRVENGRRPPSAAIAAACDRVWPERRGWFTEWYEDSRSWVPASFRSFAEIEVKATSLRVWSPSVIDGLLQTEDYARAMLATLPGATAEMVTARLASRMELQRNVLYREDPPEAWFVVDELSLYREVGGPDVMAGQMQHLAYVASLPNVTLQILPAVAHAASSSELIVTESAAYVEHLTGGLVYVDAETVTPLVRLFATIGAESSKASESLATTERLRAAWATGESPLTATRRAVSA